MSAAGKGCCLDATIETVVAERAGVLRLARAQCAAIDSTAKSRGLSDDDASFVKATLRAFADAVATGLHRDGHELPEVRAALRAVVKGEE